MAEEENTIADAANQAKKKIIKESVKKAILANLSWIVPLAGIIVLIAIVAITIYGFVANGSVGRTPTTLPDPNNAQDMAASEELKARTGDAGAATNGIALAADDIVKNIDRIARDSGEQEGGNPAKWKELGISLYSASPTNSAGVRDLVIMFSLCDDLSTKTDEELLAILEVYNNIKKGKDEAYLTPESIPKEQKTIDPELCKYAPSDSERSRYSREIEDILSGLQRVTTILSATVSPQVILSGKDRVYLEQNQIDIRIINALNYLTTPVNLGGAGFRKIKVSRIKAQYDTNNRKFSNEWNESEEALGFPDEERAISAHWDGQAMDIASIDMVNRRLYKKSIVKKKITGQSPIDIEVIRQSTNGGRSFGSENGALNGGTFGDMFKNQGTFGLMSLLAEAAGYDASGLRNEGGGFTEIIKNLGLMILKQEIGLSFNPNDDNSTPEKMFENIGAAVLSDCLGISKTGVRGGNFDEKEVNIGREELAKKFDLPELSFTGSTSDELFTSIGKRRVEAIFDLYPGSLDGLDVNQTGRTNYFTAFIGGIIIEKRMELPRGSMTPDDYATIKGLATESKLDKMRENPPMTDSRLSIYLDIPGTTDSYTSRFLRGALSPFDYKLLVGNSAMSAFYNAFSTYRTTGDNLSVNAPENPYTSVPEDYALTYSVSADNGPERSSADDVWGVPNGSIGKIKVNDFRAFYDIGVNEITKRLGTNNAEKFVLERWFKGFRTGSLTDLRYIETKFTKDPAAIKTLEDLRSLNDTEIGRIRQARANIDNYVSQINRIKLEAGGRIGNSGRLELNTSEAHTVALYEKYISQNEETILTQGGTLKKPSDGKEEPADESTWISITEEELISGSGLGLAPGDISEIFIKNNFLEIAEGAGKGRISNIELRQADPENFDENIKAKLGFLNDQKIKNEIKAEEIEAQIASLPSESIGSAEMKALEDDKAFYERNVTVWEREIKNTEDSVATDKANEANANKSRNNNPGSRVRCTGVEAVNTIENFSDAAKALGVIKFEEALGIPRGSLNPDFFATKEDYVRIGRKHIEETLSLKKDAFTGENLKELRESLGGDASFLSTVFPKQDTGYLLEALPITEENRIWFKGISKYTDDLFNIDDETTYDLLAENITPSKYCEKVGRAYVERTVPDSLTQILNINIGGYRITGEDVKYLMNGDYLAVAIKVGSKLADEGLNLPYGAIKGLIDNPEECAVTNASGRVESCIENLLAANGEQRLANYMGLFGNVLMSDNVVENMGQARFEAVIDPGHTLPTGWFSGSSLQTDIPLRLAKEEYPEQCSAISDPDKPFGFTNPTCNERTAEFKRKIAQVFGFDPRYSLAELKTLDYGVASTSPYVRSREIDSKLGIALGLTGEMLNEKINIDEYKGKIQKAYSKNTSEDWLLANIPGDVGEYIRENNLGVAEIKEFYSYVQDDSKRALIKGLMDRRSQYIKDDDTSKEELIGEAVIEQTLGGTPIGWFDAIKPSALKIEGETNSATNSVINMIFENLAKEKLEESPQLETFIGDKDALIKKMKSSQLERLAFNMVFVKNLNRTDLLTPKNIIDAEYEILRRFGIAGDPLTNNFDLIQINSFSEGDEVFDSAKTVDAVFGIKEGSTLDLLQNRLDVDGYKERVKKAYLLTHGGEVAYSQLLPENVKNELYKHGLSARDVISALKDPGSSAGTLFYSFLPAQETAVLMGFFGEDLPFLKGEFPENYAQKIVEETLGLKPGSFSPDSNIKKVAEENGAKKFASSFRIYLNTDDPGEAYINNALSNVYRPDINSTYWSDPISIKRAKIIDGILKISTGDENRSPTKRLLQTDDKESRLSIREYLEIVKKAQFEQIDPEAFASFLMTGDPESSGTIRRNLAAYNAAKVATDIYKDPANIKKASNQIALVNALKELANIDIDDKLGFQAGATTKIIKTPDRTQSILLAEGMRAVAEKAIFGNEDVQGLGLSEDLKNDLLTLFQYYIPGLDSRDIYTSPTNNLPDGSCTASSSRLTEEQARNFARYQRSRCQNYVINGVLGTLIERQTTINTSDGRVVPGIKLSDTQLSDLVAGNTRILASTSVAYTITALKIDQNPDPGDESIKLIPDEFFVTQQEAYDAMYGGENLKSRAGEQAGRDYASQWRDDQILTYNQAWASKNPGEPLPAAVGPPSQNDEKTRDYQEGLLKAQEKPGLGAYLAKDPRAVSYYNGGAKAIQKAQQDAPGNAKRLLQYRYYDAQMRSIARKNNSPPIPFGFSKTMLEGTPEEREDMYVRYGLSALVSATFFRSASESASENERLLFFEPFEKTVVEMIGSKGPLNTDKLIADFGPRFEDNFKTGIFNRIDLELEQKWNVAGLSGIGRGGFTANIAHAVMNGGEFATDSGFKGDARDFAIANISHVVDKQLGLPGGTSYKGYTMYKFYKSYADASRIAKTAQTTLSEARVAFEGSKNLLGIPTPDATIKLANAEASATNKAAAASKSKLAMKGAIITITTEILLTVFAEDLAKLDASLGVPPGTISGAISLGVTAYVTQLTGAGPAGIYIAAAFFLYNLFFGFSKVEYQITCPQDTLGPALSAFSRGRTGVHPMGGVNYDSYCKETENLHTQWAQINTRNLIYELLIMGSVKRDPRMTPTIIGTFRKEDVEFFNGSGGTNLVQEIYGTPGMERGVKGIYQSSYMGGFVHVGY